MYHYVLPVGGEFPWELKGLDLQSFIGQLGYIDRHYNTVTLADVAAAREGKAHLPPNPCVLTFDDGLAGHHDLVLPELSRIGMKASFFPSSAPLSNHRMLDAHRIHLLLGTGISASQIICEMFSQMDVARRELLLPEPLPSNQEFYASLAVPGRYDPPEVIFIKRALQSALPTPVRKLILDSLFERFVTKDEEALASEFYMSYDQLRNLVNSGMEVGGHGLHHHWLEQLTEEEVGVELDATTQLLEKVYGSIPDRWVMAYPYGSFNRHTVGLLRGAGCAAAVTVKVGLATDADSLLKLPRLDTNDLPRSADAPVSRWTAAASQGRPRATASVPITNAAQGLTPFRA